MNIDELRTVQSRERSTSDLQELRDSFYSDVAEYVGQLRDERDRLAAERDDPYDDEVIRLTDKIQTAEQVAESIYERRVGKVVKRASFAANGLDEEPAGLTAEEQDLYADIVDRIELNKATVLDIVTNGESTSPVDINPPDDHDTAQDDTSSASTVDGPATEPPSDESATSDTDPATPDTDASDTAGRETVRITEDVGEIYGVDDRVYTLETDDVVSLPEENAGPLIERDAAESLE